MGEMPYDIFWAAMHASNTSTFCLSGKAFGYRTQRAYGTGPNKSSGRAWLASGCAQRPFSQVVVKASQSLPTANLSRNVGFILSKVFVPSACSLAVALLTRRCHLCLDIER